jgi:hypothetical protein
MNDNHGFHTFDAPPVEPASQMNGLNSQSKLLAEINEKYSVVMDGANAGPVTERPSRAALQASTSIQIRVGDITVDHRPGARRRRSTPCSTSRAEGR